jgi:hypothetical protein
MLFSDNEISARLPIWEAMSELFLDNDNNPYEYVARVCAASKFNIDELETILFEDIYPVLSPNLSITGFVWTGFDQEWLRERILSGSHPAKSWHAPPHKFFRRWASPWRQLRKQILNLRIST